MSAGPKTANRLFTGPVTFLKSAPSSAELPAPGLPEIAFAGRSNVGKSSLLNALVGRSGLARTSNTPGRTQLLNLFDVGTPPVLRLVDMPGYGYAEAPKDMQMPAGMNYNTYFPGHMIGMPVPLTKDQVTFDDGTPATVEQMAKDVSAFLMWTAEPHLVARKRMGLQVCLHGIFLQS